MNIRAMKLPARSRSPFLMSIGEFPKMLRDIFKEATAAIRNTGINTIFCGTKESRIKTIPFVPKVSIKREDVKPKAAPLYIKTNKVAGKPMMVSPETAITISKNKFLMIESKKT